MHDISLISTIALGFGFAFVFGMLAKRLGLSPILGYLIAGIIVGPHTPGFVADVGLAAQLAELGVILLMFGVGMHFHWKDLMVVRSIAIPGALVQSTFAAIAMMFFAHALGWTWTQGLVLGMALAVASTVVLLRVLMDHHHLETAAGHVAIGWLIVEDIITVLVLVVLPALGQAALGADVPVAPGAAAVVSDGPGVAAVAGAMGLALFKLVVLVVVVGIGGAWAVPRLLLRVARLRDPELFTLSILVMSIAVATLSYVALGVSMALGAFLAGMLVGQSKFSHQAAAEMLPLRDAFAVLFFVSVGMLFDYEAALAEPWLAASVLFVIMIVKPLAAFAIVIFRGYSLRTALTVAGALSQIGEFSFILADAAVGERLLPPEARSPLVLGALVSISVNPFFYRGMLALEPRISELAVWKRWFASHAQERADAHAPNAADVEPQRQLAVVVGYGPVGRNVTGQLIKAGFEPIVVEMNIDTVAELHEDGRVAIYGDATRRDILEQAQIHRAKYLIVTSPVAATQIGAVTAAREMNEELLIITRARFAGEMDALRNAGATMVCSDEISAATELAHALLEYIHVSTEVLELEARQIREGWTAEQILAEASEASDLGDTP